MRRDRLPTTVAVSVDGRLAVAVLEFERHARDRGRTVGSGKSAGFVPEIMAPESVDAGSEGASFRER